MFKKNVTTVMHSICILQGFNSPHFDSDRSPPISCWTFAVQAIQVSWKLEALPLDRISEPYWPVPKCDFIIHLVMLFLYFSIHTHTHLCANKKRREADVFPVHLYISAEFTGLHQGEWPLNVYRTTNYKV